MKRFEYYLNKAFVVSVIYLLAIILGGFFILPGIFQVDSYSFPPIVELFIKITSAIATIIVLSSAVIIPVLKLVRKPKQQTNSAVTRATATLLAGLILIFLNGVYVKLKACPEGGSNAWHCRVEGNSYVGMLVLVFFVASLVGLITWIFQKFAKKK